MCLFVACCHIQCKLCTNWRGGYSYVIAVVLVVVVVVCVGCGGFQITPGLHQTQNCATPLLFALQPQPDTTMNFTLLCSVKLRATQRWHPLQQKRAFWCACAHDTFLNLLSDTLYICYILFGLFHFHRTNWSISTRHLEFFLVMCGVEQK